jgi:hypothetical protein
MLHLHGRGNEDLLLGLHYAKAKTAILQSWEQEHSDHYCKYP